MPTVSVLMPVRNGERFVGEAIDSILRQTFADLELLVINDASTDRSAAIARSYADPRVRVVDNDRRLGLPGSLNRGLELAQGEYIARQDADDTCDPDRLRRQVERLRHGPEVLVGTRAAWVDADGRWVHVSSPVLSTLQIRWGYIFAVTGICGASAMYVRDVVQRVGRYNEEFLWANDAEFNSRVARLYRVANLPDPLYHVRLHDMQMTQTYGTIPQNEADRLTYANVAVHLSADGTDGGEWAQYRDDLAALRALYTLEPRHLDRLASPRIRWLLGRVFARFQQRYGNDETWPEFVDWLASDWLTAANVHLPDRPHLALWLWWMAVRMIPVRAFHPASVRFLAKLGGFPVYRRLRSIRSARPTR